MTLRMPVAANACPEPQSGGTGRLWPSLRPGCPASPGTGSELSSAGHPLRVRVSASAGQLCKNVPPRRPTRPNPAGHALPLPRARLPSRVPSGTDVITGASGRHLPLLPPAALLPSLRLSFSVFFALSLFFPAPPVTGSGLRVIYPAPFRLDRWVPASLAPHDGDADAAQGLGPLHAQDAERTPPSPSPS